jgi:hypothetical protein
MKRRASLNSIWNADWVEQYFDLPFWGRAVLLGILAALLGLILDEAAHAIGSRWFYERLLENALEGFLIGIVVFWLSLLREKRMDRRMREIGYLNHHIRNAMQAITLVAHETADAQQRMAVIDLSVRRVIETLSRINRETDELGRERGLDFEYAA